MIIHVVQQGETISSIAQSYGVSERRLIQENEIPDPNRLVVGESIVILFPAITYTIQVGDSLVGIAKNFGVSVMQLLRNNPYLSNREYIYPGETIVISYKDNKISKLSTNGYAYPFIHKDILIKTLPFLTYLTIYAHTVTEEGEVLPIDDTVIIQIAKDYCVAPIMMLTGLGKTFSEEINLAHDFLVSPEKQERFMNNILIILKAKGYYGVNTTTPYIFPEDRELYVTFMSTFADFLNSEGFILFETFSLTTFELIAGTYYQGLEYARIGQLVNGVMLISYEWGLATGIPTGIIAYNTVSNFLGYMVENMPSKKVFIGVPNVGYIWQLPYEAGVTKGIAISYKSAIALAADVGAEIQYDEVTKTCYFQYVVVEEYIVRFRDARSINDSVALVPEFDLNGIGIWNIMIFFPQMWLVINSQYEIEKIL